MQKSLIFIYFSQGRRGPSGAVGAIRPHTGSVGAIPGPYGADGPKGTFHLPVLYIL
jgi:hypothetical protein